MNTKVYAALAAICGVWVLLLSLAWFVSPRLYASSLATAALTNDVATLGKRVDIERLRESAKDELTDVALAGYKLAGGGTLPDAMRTELMAGIKDLSPADDPILLQKLGYLLSGKGFVTAPVYSALPKDSLAKRTGEASGEFGDTLDLYFYRLRFKETGEALSLMYERRGFFTWRLVAVKANGGSVLVPLKRN